MSKFITNKEGQELIRKELHIPPDVLKQYKILAANADKSPKEFMEDVLIAHIKPKKSK